MKTSSLLLLSLVILASACARPGVAPGDASKGYVVWGYVGVNSQQAATNQPVALIDKTSGQPVATASTDMMGKYVFAYHQPGQYVVQVGSVYMPVSIASVDQRLDIDLSNPTGAMNYAQTPPPPKSKGKGQKNGGARGPNGEPMPDVDQPYEGSNCWASAGCGGYDSSTDTYTDETGAPQ